MTEPNINDRQSSECRDEEAAFFAELDHEQLNADLLNEAALYRNTGDGRFLWRSLLTLHEAGEPMPPNLFDKFAEWAHKVLAAKDVKEIASALDLAGDEKSHVGPRQSQKYEKRWRIASEVQILIKQQKWAGRTLSLNAAFKAVARNNSGTGWTVAKVKKAYDDVFRAPARRVKATRNPAATLEAAWRSR